MRFGTLCSGIEGAAVALQPLGWELAFSAEIEPYCCALLAAKYPGVPNLGDITTTRNVPGCHVIVSGTPCQPFSVQGRRRGMDEVSGQLAIRFAEIVRDCDPRWIVWENVPGVLTSNRGRDFARFRIQMGQLGYWIAYRVLDAQYFGVAQRRRRVFVVGSHHSWQRAAAVLFDRPACGHDGASAQTIRSRQQLVSDGLNGTLLGWTGDETPKYGIEVCPTLRAQQGGEGAGIVGTSIYRKLTLTEWERLQGFPDGYTAIEGFGESARKKALGNAFCVPVIRWIGQRIQFLEETR